MLLTLADKPPEGDDWIHEIKYDGYRTILAVDGPRTRAFTRNGFDWTAKYGPIVSEAAALPCSTAIIDAEMIVQNAEGVSDFHDLRSAIRTQPERLALYAFDLLMLDGHDLRSMDLTERRHLLEDLIGHEAEGRIHFSSSVEGNGAEFFRAADRLGLEGIVSKRADSRYITGERFRQWLKTKTFAVGEFEVVGVEKSSTGIPIALLARGDDYVGNAMIILGGKSRAEFWRRIDALGTPHARLLKLHKRNAKWIGPGLIATVRHLRGEEKLRHATIMSVREADRPGVA